MMENNDNVDPLEKAMQELESNNVDSYPYSSQPKELPHRPIVIPPEIKEEPLDGETEFFATTTATNCETAENARSGESTGDDAKGTASAQALTPKEVSEDNPTATQSNVTITTESVVSIPSAEVQHANFEPSTTTPTPHVSLDNAETQQANVAPTTASSPHEPQIKQERPDDEGEATRISASNPTKSVVSENEFGCRETQATVNLPRIKSEPIDANDAALPMNVALLPPNQVAVRRNTVTHTPVGKKTSHKPRTNHNLENGEIDMDETLPDNFFDDLLQDADNITAAAFQATTEPDDQIISETNRIKNEPLDSTNAPEVTQSVPIPDNFFDDLLVDHVAERIEDVVNQDLEEKYSKRLRELQQLESVDERSNKAHKKHKKKKKKSHKRSHSDILDDEEHKNGPKKRSKRIQRSNSKSPNSRTISLIENSCSPEPVTQPTRIRVKSEFMEIPDSPQRSGSLFPHAAAHAFHPTTLDIINLDIEEPTTSVAAARRAMPPNLHNRTIRVKSEFATFPARNPPSPAEDEIPDISLPVQEKELFLRRGSNNRNELIIDMTTPLGLKRIKLEKDVEKSKEKLAALLSPKEKMLQAKQRAIAAIEALKKGNNTEKGQMVEFIHTTTVRKLPNSSSYYKQQIYENRSPLHNVNNVHYKFNSHTNQFDLHEWGLEEMPKVARKVAKLLGFDTHALSEKLLTFKLPPQLQKIKQECLEQQADEKMSLPQTSFLVTVATQTNEVTVLESAAERRKNLHDIGVEAMPLCYNAATQTTAAFAMSTTNYDDLPLMQQIKTLNENQLMALSDFAELLCEPAPASDASAMDLYRLRQRMMDIYKCAQLPSALEPAAPQMGIHPPPSRPHSRDPRIEHMATILESPPPAPPKLHTVHPSQMVHRFRPAMVVQSAMPPVQPRDSTLPVMPHKIPVISNVQSLRANPAAETSKYYGRGGMRR